MADIINLRRARKAKARTSAVAEADANRRKYGRSKAEKTLQDAQATRERRHLDQRLLDQKRLDPEDSDR
jgi:hypothetical protein